MITVSDRLITNYAKAFFRFRQNKLTENELLKLKELEHFLTANKGIAIFLCVPSIPLENKQKALDTILNHFDIPKEYRNLTYLLLRQGHISYLGKILNTLAVLDAQAKKKESFLVSSSHELTSDERNDIISFIKKQISSEIIPSFKINKLLISGLRIQSTHHYWERSMAKQLKVIAQTLQKQGVL